MIHVIQISGALHEYKKKKKLLSKSKIEKIPISQGKIETWSPQIATSKVTTDQTNGKQLTYS